MKLMDLIKLYWVRIFVRKTGTEFVFMSGAFAQLDDYLLIKCVLYD